MSNTSRHLVKVTEKIAENLGVKFCTSCNLTKPVGGGKTKSVANGRTRWLCASCANKQKPMGFSEKRRQDAVPKLRPQDGVQSDQKLHGS
jgi:hypothetical protein